MIYFTSDLHLGHDNAIEFKRRPFANVEEMNQKLIRNINETVGPNDELWVLGDFSYKINKEQVRQLRREIQCRHVHLIYGNHDKDYSSDHIFQSVQYYKELKTAYGKFVLFHYPILEWNAAHYGSIHLHGHIHSTGEYNAENLKKKYIDRIQSNHLSRHDELNLRIYDVGVDANHYYPVSLEKIAQIMNLTPVYMPSGAKMMNEQNNPCNRPTEEKDSLQMQTAASRADHLASEMLRKERWDEVVQICNEGLNKIGPFDEPRTIAYLRLNRSTAETAILRIRYLNGELIDPTEFESQVRELEDIDRQFGDSLGINVKDTLQKARNILQLLWKKCEQSYDIPF